MLVKPIKAFAAALLLLAAAGRAESPVEIHDAWIRHIPGDRPMAGYFLVENKGSVEAELVGASSARFGAAHLHESIEKDGVATMRMIESVTVPPGGQVEFGPGGFHLMLMERRDELQVGDEVSVTLEFANGDRPAVPFTVKPSWQE